MLADEAIAHDLLNKRGIKYSDRPRLVMANECLEKGMHIMFRDYNDAFRKHQRMEASVLTFKASTTYQPLQDLESRKMLYDFLSHQGFAHNFERYAFSVIHTLTFGIRAELGDSILSEVQQIERNIVEAGTFGKWIVDAFPFLNHLPAPLAPWKRIAEANHEFEKAVHLKNMKRGLDSKAWNWTKEFTRSVDGKNMDTVEMAYDLGILAGAGVTTTAGVLQVFVLAAVSNPDIMLEARKELDAVVGTNRLPTFDDRTRLPFVHACMKEVFRWRTILPCTFPHHIKVEDEYRGYRIPANSTIVPLQWCMNHDERNFSDPHRFDPARWLKSGAEELRYHAFGFGRRICPGRHMAENSVFLGIARLLWAYDIKPDSDWQYDDNAWDPQFFTRPLDLRATFHVRSPAHRAVIEREWREADLDTGMILDGILQRRNETR
jgi:cytochrome P450